MKTKTKTLLSAAAFLLCAAGIAVYAANRPEAAEAPERHRMRVVVPTGNGLRGHYGEVAAGGGGGNAYVLKSPMEPGELVISVLNFDTYNRGIMDQAVAFRAVGNTGNTVGNTGNAAGSTGNGANGNGEAPVSVAFFSFDPRTSGHRRMWDLPTSATVPGTVALFTLDILGDRSSTIIVTGMNDRGEHTMTVFRRNPASPVDSPFDVIADISIDGSVAVRETARSLAYQQGIALGEPFVVVASGRDPDSENILDRIELTYAFNPAAGVYRPAGAVRVAGARIEQDRVRQILSGAPGVFEDFVGDLWYHVTPAGTIDRNQFIYFDPLRREIIFFGEENKQIFAWQNSNTTRQGLFISAYNRTVTAMRRRVNIELESMDSIRVTVTDERRARIGVPPPWSGSYRRAGAIVRAMEETLALAPHKDAVFDSPIGRIRFLPCGGYELTAHGSSSRGRHVFFSSGGRDMLELRPDSGYAETLAMLVSAGGSNGRGDSRQIFQVTGISRDPRGRPDPGLRYMGLSRVLLGASGIHELNEARILLTRAY